MGDIFWAIVAKQYPHITTIYAKMQKTNLIYVEPYQGKHIKALPHSSAHTSVC